MSVSIIQSKVVLRIIQPVDAFAILNKAIIYENNACHVSRDLVRFHRTLYSCLAERSQRYYVSYNSSDGRGKKKKSAGW